MNEPSLLDYLAAKLRFWRPPPDGLPSVRQLWSSTGEGEDFVPGERKERPALSREPRFHFRLDRGEGPAPLAVSGALLLSLLAAFMIARGQQPAAGVVLVMATAGAVVLAAHRGEIPDGETTPQPAEIGEETRPKTLLIISAGLATVIAGVAAMGNRAGPIAIPVWIIALGLATTAVTAPGAIQQWFRDRAESIRGSRWTIGLERSALLPLALLVTAVLIRTDDLARAPAEMTSGHAELLMALIRAGQPESPIVFGGGMAGFAPIPVYFGALFAWLVGEPSFLALKLGTLLAGLATLPLVYLLGFELGGRATGLAAMALAAVGSWPNLVSRIGFADGWYPPLAAASLLFLIRGIRHGRRFDFAAGGIAIGLGIQTAPMARSLVATAVILTGLAAVTAGPDRRRRLAVGLGILLVFVAVAGLPTLIAAHGSTSGSAGLLWFGVTEPVRDHSVMTGLFERFGRTLALPLLSDGPTWIHGSGRRPALDLVAAGLLILGVLVTIVRAVRRRRLEDALLLAAVPLLMLPAVLAPLEPEIAPSPLRCGGAMAPVFVLAGIGLATAVSAGASFLAAPVGRRLAGAAAVAVISLSALAGHGIVHGAFVENWDRSVWNTSELGSVVRGALLLGVPPERTRVVPFPYWVDTRLVAFEAGLPGADLAIAQDKVNMLAGRAGPKLFLVHPDDHRTLGILRRQLPVATPILQPSRIQNKAFLSVMDLSLTGGD